MNKEIFFMTSAPVVEQLPGFDLYDSFDLVSRGVLSAPLIANASEIIKKQKFSFPLSDIKIIYTATSGQTLATARLLHFLRMDQTASIKPVACLDNIRFSLLSLMSKHEFFTLSVDEALTRLRREFVIHLYQNKFSEPLSVFVKRLEAVLQIVGETKLPCLFIVHSFFLQLLKIYTTQPECFGDLELLLTSFKPECKPFESLISVLGVKSVTRH